jgi:hypothetical protein
MARNGQTRIAATAESRSWKSSSSRVILTMSGAIVVRKRHMIHSGKKKNPRRLMMNPKKMNLIDVQAQWTCSKEQTK